MLLGQDVGPLPDPEGARSLRTFRLVGARARRRSAPSAPTSSGSHGAAWTASTWNRIPRRALTIRRDLGDGLERPDLVVGEHHGHQDRAVRDRPLDVRRVDAPVAVDGHLDDLEPELLEVRERVADRVVLHRRGDDPRAARPAGPRGALEREVDRLGPAAREHDLAGVRPDRPREPLVRVVEGLAGGPTPGVRGRRVAEDAAQVRQHRLEDLGAQRRRRGVVEVDRHGPRIVRPGASGSDAGPGAEPGAPGPGAARSRPCPYTLAEPPRPSRRPRGTHAQARSPC